jgi:chitodextrinase
MNHLKHTSGTPGFSICAFLVLQLFLTACGGGGGGGFLSAVLGGSVDLDAHATSSDAIHLSWSKPSGGVTVSSYTVARNDERSRQALVSTPARSYTVTGLQPGTRYCFEIRAPITANRMSKATCATTFADTQPPSSPRELSATVLSPTHVQLQWRGSSDRDRITGYHVYRDGTLLETTNSTNTDDQEAAPSTQYCYTVTASDPSGNESQASNQVCATTHDDTEDPSAPSNLTVAYQQISAQPTITLQWGASSDDGAIGHYRVFRDGVFYADALSPTHEDANLEPDTLYCYTVSAVDRADKESAQTEAVCARTSWLSSQFDEQYVNTVAIAVDANGDTHFAYKQKEFDSSAGEYLVTLRYRNIEAGQRSASTVLEQGIDTFWFSDTYLLAMAVDPATVAHLVHKRRNEFGSENVQHIEALKSGQSLRRTVQGSEEQMGGISLVSDDTGDLHLCMSLDRQLIYSTNESGDWISTDADTLVPGSAGIRCDIALDQHGNIHVSFIETGTNDLMYLSNASGAWVVERLDPYDGSGLLADFQTAIAIDPAGSVHIVYFHNADEMDLEYATNASGGWQTSVLDSEGKVGLYCDIAVDSNGYGHVVYKDVTQGPVIKYATNRSGNWRPGHLTSAGSGDVAITLDAQDNVHVVIAQGPNGRLTYMTNSP